jgi:hypothetical protein
MEVHAHSHTARKKWTHYFWEFLMLFLAVFCGFLAENKREHMVEHKRAKEYAKVLVSDLSADTIGLKQDLQGLSQTIAFQDSFQADLLKKLAGEKVPGARLYYYAFFNRGNFQFAVKTATLNQLKNSGSLRYFRNFDIIRLINDYDQAIQVQMGRENIDLSSFNRLGETTSTLFSFYQLKKLEHLFNEMPQSSQDSILNIDLPLMNNSIEVINNMAYALSARKTNLQRRERLYYRNPYNIAKQLIDALKREYRLE